METKTDRLAKEITTLAAHIHAATCRWLELIAEFDDGGGWAEQGAKSCAHWISWTCGVSPGPAREHVRVAHRLREMPAVREAFAAGRLSYSKVRAMTRLEHVEDERGLVELALDASAAQLERILRAHRSSVEVDEATERAFRSRYVHWSHDEDGALTFQGRLPAEEGALVLAALEAARGELVGRAAGDAVREPTSPVEAADSAPEATEKVSIRQADALVAMADTFLARGLADRPSAERHQVVVHVDVKSLSAPSAPGSRDGQAGAVAGTGCELEDGAQLPQETARRLCCDGSIVRIVERDGQPLSVGRKTRSIPPAIRRALRRRDRCCRFPGCGQTHGVDAHHIEHWAHGGQTRLDNLVQLCRFHHRLVHEGGYSVERSGAGAGSPADLRTTAFRRPDGRRVEAHPRLPRSDGRRLGADHALRRLKLTDQTCLPRDGGHYDLDLAVDAVHALTRELAVAPGI